jgi:hypothetical protein
LENSVSWNDISSAGVLGNTILGSTPLNVKGTNVIDLNANGIALVQGWVNGAVPNNGFVLRSEGTTNGIDFFSRENTVDVRPALTITYTTN